MSHRKRQQSLSAFFPQDFELVYCNDVEGLKQKLGCTHNPEEWRRLSDSSNFILKAMLLCKGKIHLSIPIAYRFHMKEIYEHMDLLFKAVNYSKYERKICGDHKDIGSLIGMQSG